MDRRLAQEKKYSNQNEQLGLGIHHTVWVTVQLLNPNRVSLSAKNLLIYVEVS